MNNDVEPVRCVVMGRWRGCRAPSRQRHHGRLLSSRIGKGESVACLGSADRFAAVYLRGCILHGDHDRSRDPSQLTIRQAAYALAIGATAMMLHQMTRNGSVCA